MATYWVRSSGGDDGEDGTTYAKGWATIAHALDWILNNGTKGDILNVVADGDHTMPTSGTTFGTGFTGTDFDSDPGFTIRGTDSSGDPALATIVASADGVPYQLIKCNPEAEYFVVEGLKIDATGSETSTSNFAIFMESYAGAPAGGPFRIQYCSFLTGSTQVPGGIRRLLSYSLLGSERQSEVRYCYFQNYKSPIYHRASNTAVTSGCTIEYCVFWSNFSTTPVIFTANDNTVPEPENRSYTFKNNTIFYQLAAGTSQIFTPTFMSIDRDNSNPDIGTVHMHSNILWAGTDDNGASLVTVDVHPLGINGAGGTVSFLSTKDIGYNIVLYGGGITSSDLDVNGNYEVPFDPDDSDSPEGTDTYIGDNITYENASDAALFNDSSSSYDWENINSSGYTITLPGDLRPRYAYWTLGKNGSVPGALPEAPEAPIAVADTYTLTHCAVHDIAAGIGVLSNDSNLGTQTMTASLVSDVGEGTLVFNADGSFSYLPAEPTAVGSTSFTYQAINEIGPSNITTVTLNLSCSTGVVEPEYIDVAPFYLPDTQVSMELLAQVKRNRLIHIDLRSYTELQRWRESTHRLIQIAASTTTPSDADYTLGGVEKATFVILETDLPIQVALNGTAQYLSVNSGMAIQGAAVTGIHFRNTNTSSAAEVLVAVVD